MLNINTTTVTVPHLQIPNFLIKKLTQKIQNLVFRTFPKDIYTDWETENRKIIEL